MATVYKIHPAIGIARVGNSPDEFFIGPERIGEHLEPEGGFKDAQCRVKRQAARFRIYAHHDDGSVEEITDAEADISWTVHLVNKKAANPGHGNSEPASDMIINPGTRTLSGPNQIKEFDTGQIKFSGVSAVTVPLGEIRSDDDNHLLVIGGFGQSNSPLGTGIGSFWANDDWYDDVSDGSVTATIKIRATNDEPEVNGAWIIVAPPKFAPHIDNVITLYDRILQEMVDAGLAIGSATTSYTRDIFPILQRGRDTNWVEDVAPAHSWTDPVTSDADRNGIFNRLTAPGAGGTDMPDLRESTPGGRLTPIQYAHMERWKDDNYTNDWTGVPATQANITPDGLDRAALENCVGGAFYPGIEAGGRSASERPIITPANYLETFRLNHAVISPGDITYTMALPWQADFNACGDNWWPVPRPNDVVPQGQTDSVKWDRYVGDYEDMVRKWHTLGFIVQQGSQHVEVDRCNTPSITLLTPHLNFQDVPQGPLGMVREQPLAITFEVISPSSDVTLSYAPGGALSHTQLFSFNTSDTVGPTPANQVATVRLWVIFRASLIGAIPLQTVIVQNADGSLQWTITITGNTVARKTTAVALVLDRSGSMSESQGAGQSKHTSLQQAASIFVDVMLEGDGVGLVRYNQDAQTLQQVLQLGSGGLSDTNLVSTTNMIYGNNFDPQGNLNPQGSTSIGNGIFEGRNVLNSTTIPYDIKSLVVLTDGKENRSRYIADVAAQINEQTYAIGLGTPQNTSAPALQMLSGNNGGFLLITGAIGQDNRFLLQKYFLQILAGISNAEIVLDPTGEIVVDKVQRIPFQLTDADAGVDVILLTPNTRIVDFRLQTPKGLIIEPWRAKAEPGMQYVLSNGVSYYRLVLPTQLVADRFDQGGTWHALLTIGSPRLERTPESEDGVDRSILHHIHSVSVPEHMSKRRRMEAERATLIAEHDSTYTPNIETSFVTATTNPVAATHISDSRKQLLPYSLVVHCYSSVSLHAGAEQEGYGPGSRIQLHATLTQSGIPLQQESAVWMEVKSPDGTSTTLAFVKQKDSLFVTTFDTTVAGVYHFRVRARGQTRKGLTFTRERSLTAAVWHGGNRDAETASRGRDHLVDAMHERDERLCELLKCLTTRGGMIDAELEKQLKAKGFDLDHLRKCLHLFCRGKDTRKDDADE